MFLVLCPIVPEFVADSSTANGQSSCLVVFYKPPNESEGVLLQESSAYRVEVYSYNLRRDAPHLEHFVIVKQLVAQVIT